MIKDNNFGSFLSEIRTKKKIKLEQLSDGLCAVSMLSRIESGKREAEKLLKDCLLQRLGVIPENYENFLYYSVSLSPLKLITNFIDYLLLIMSISIIFK